MFSKDKKYDYLPHVDGLRAVAVVSVLLFHLGLNGAAGGFVGVDIFFVISGFLITRLIRSEIESTGSFSFQNFYFRRVRRLLPAYLLTLAIAALTASLLFSPAHLERFGVALSSAVLSVSNFFFWFEADYFDTSAQIKPLLHTWTLGVEEQFYLIWPLSIVLIYRFGVAKWVSYILLLVALVSLYLNYVFGDGEVSLISQYFPRYGVTLIANGKSTIFFLLPFRLFEFMIGASLVWMVGCFPKRRWMNEIICFLGVFMIAYSVIFFDDTMLFPSYYALLPCVGAAFLIVSGGRANVAIIFNNRLFVGIGLISYSLYLVHWPIIVFWQYSVAPDLLTRMDRIAIVAISFLIAIICYFLVEKPFRKSSFAIGMSKWKASLVVCTVLFGLGLHMKHSGGWPRSIPYTVNFDNVGSAANYQKKYNGGAGYPDVGPINTLFPPDVILVGDSHGKHYAEGLYKEFVQPNKLSMYIVSGNSCFHLPGFTRTSKGKNWDRLCSEAVDQVVSYVQLAKKPPIVVVSHSWVSQMNRADILDENHKPMGKQVGSKDIVVALNKLKQRIHPAKLVVVGNVPTTNGRNLYDIFTRPSIVSSIDFELDAYLVTEVRQTLQDFNRALIQFGKDEGVVVLDPLTVLCDGNQCANVDPDMYLIYSDKSHLGKRGSRFVVKQFLPDLMPLLLSR